MGFCRALFSLLLLHVVPPDRQIQPTQVQIPAVDIAVHCVSGNLRQRQTLQQNLPHSGGRTVTLCAYVIFQMCGQLRAELDRAALVQVVHLVGAVLRFLGGVDGIHLVGRTVQLLTLAALYLSVDGALTAPDHRCNLRRADLSLQ